MTNFQRDLEILINEGVFAGKNGKIRFVFRYSNRLRGEIENLDLSARGYNSMRRVGIDTIEKITEKWDKLGIIKNMGVKTTKEIKNKYLAFYYDQLRSDEERKQFWRDTIMATIEM